MFSLTNQVTFTKIKKFYKRMAKERKKQVQDIWKKVKTIQKEDISVIKNRGK